MMPPPPPDPDEHDDVIPKGASFEMVLEDNFDGPAGAPPPDHWSPEIGNGQNGWGNGQLEYDTGRPENVSLDGDGHLVLTARKEEFNGFDYTAARLITRPDGNTGDGMTDDGFITKYGRVEAKIKLPKGKGLWPAFWMLGRVQDDQGRWVNWPECGEIDILEFRGHNVSEIRSSLHGPNYNGLENFGLDVDVDEDLTKGFHVYGMTWSKLGISFDFDGEPYFSVLKEDFPPALDWKFDHPFFLILNLAVGGNYLKDAQPDDSTPFPAELVVDYVHVYKLVEP